jgi:hypothetical protein
LAYRQASSAEGQFGTTDKAASRRDTRSSPFLEETRTKLCLLRQSPDQTMENMSMIVNLQPLIECVRWETKHFNAIDQVISFHAEANLTAADNSLSRRDSGKPPRKEHVLLYHLIHGSDWTTDEGPHELIEFTIKHLPEVVRHLRPLFPERLSDGPPLLMDRRKSYWDHLTGPGIRLYRKSHDDIRHSLTFRTGESIHIRGISV